MKKLLLGILGIAFGLMSGVGSVLAQTPGENRLLVFTDGGWFVGISDNAKWAAGYLTHEAGFLINLETETVIQLLSNEVNYSEAKDVADDGTVVGTANGLPAYWTSDGKYDPLPLPPGNFEEGQVAGITPDGKIISGYVYDSGFSATPLRWLRQDDGSYKVEKLKGLDKDLFGKRPLGGFFVDAISADGSMIAGRMCDNNYGWFPVLWKNVEETPLPVVIAKDRQMTDAGKWNGWNCEIFSFSADNKLLLGVYTDNSVEYGPTHGYVYNIAEDLMTLPEMSGDVLSLVTSDGKLISASPAGFPYRSAFIDVPGKGGFKLEDYVQEHFGVNMLEQLDGSGTPMAISADEKSIVGFAGYNGSAMAGFCLQMGKDVTSVRAEKLEKPAVYADVAGNITVQGAKGAKVTLADLSGRVISTCDANSDAVLLPGIKGQVYLVKVAFDHVIYLSKVIVY